MKNIFIRKLEHEITNFNTPRSPSHSMRLMFLFFLREAFDPWTCFGEGHPYADVQTSPNLSFHDDQRGEPDFALFAEIGHDKMQCHSERFHRWIGEDLVAACPKVRGTGDGEELYLKATRGLFSSIRSSLT